MPTWVKWKSVKKGLSFAPKMFGRRMWHEAFYMVEDGARSPPSLSRVMLSVLLHPPPCKTLHVTTSVPAIPADLADLGREAARLVCFEIVDHLSKIGQADADASLGRLRRLRSRGYGVKGARRAWGGKCTEVRYYVKCMWIKAQAEQAKGRCHYLLRLRLR